MTRQPISFFLLMMPRQRRSTLFPYTTLFRSAPPAMSCTKTCRLPPTSAVNATDVRSEEHTSELQSLRHLVCRLLLEKKNDQQRPIQDTFKYAVYDHVARHLRTRLP